MAATASFAAGKQVILTHLYPQVLGGTRHTPGYGARDVSSKLRIAEGLRALCINMR